MVYEVHITTINKNFSYKVKAENVLEAEELAKKRLKKDKNVRDKAYRRGSSISSWEVKHIENIHDGRKGR